MVKIRVTKRKWSLMVRKSKLVLLLAKFVLNIGD
jgi:hypothetical protein